MNKHQEEPTRSPSNASGFARLFNSDLTAWVVLGLSLCLTLLAWTIAQRAVQERIQDRFVHEVEDAKDRIETRMRKYEQALLGGAALFNASKAVSRSEWQAYVASLDLQAQLPGIQGFAYAEVIPQSKLNQHEAAVRADGFPSYQVHPEGKRDFYIPIVFIEPFDTRNQRAFGYDMYSDPVRRAAMDISMNTDTTAVSGLVRLRQEDGIDPQRGFLMYAPVYKFGMPLGDANQRRAAIRGFVYSPFRNKDLMKNVLGEQATALNFRIHDGKLTEPSSLVFEHTEAPSESGLFSKLRAEDTISLPNRQWRVVFEPTRAFEQEMRTDSPWLILLGGLAIDSLLFLAISSLTRQRNQQAAQNKVLEESRAKYSGLVAGLKDQFAFFSLAPSGKLTYISPTLPALLGIPKLGLNQSLLLCARQQFPNGSLAKALAGSLAGKAVTHYVHEFQRADGSTLFVEGFNNAVMDERGELISIEGVVHDITKRRNTEHELEMHRSKLEDLVRERTRELLLANKAKSQFLANMSHEIRTPLNAILGINQLMRADAQDETLRQRLQQVHTEAERLHSMLADVMRFSRLDAGHVHPQIKEFDLREAFLNVVRGFEEPAADKNLKLVHFIDPAIPPALKGDGAMYQQVLNSLLSNALKFSDHGQITVELHFEKTRNQTVQVRTDVKDEGIGFDTRELPRLLQPFEQSDNSATRQFGGSGLGLSLVNRLVSMLGGSLSAQSTLNQGSHLSFTANFEQVESSAIQQDFSDLDALRAAPLLEGKHILVVEDNQVNQQVIKSLLTRLGVRVSLSQNGEEAICKVQTDRSVDLVLMDLHMPIVNGLDATRAIRILDEPACKLPIVALTACAMDEDEAACREAGMDDYLTKPVNLPILRATLERFLINV